MATSNRASEAADAPYERRIADAQENAYRWREVARSCHQGVSRFDEAEVRKRLHVATMEYWSLLRQYQEEESVLGVWDASTGDEPVDDYWTMTVEGQRVTLADLHEFEFASNVVETDNGSKLRGSRRTQQSTPFVFSIADANRIIKRLDDLSYMLGFTKQPRRQRPRARVGGPEFWEEADE
jgi:hypothetical protein